MPLVLVNLGTIPKYLKANINYIGATFPERRKILIGNIDKTRWLAELNFEYVDANSLITEWPEQFITKGSQRFFRDDFWFTTKARLLLLPKLMRKEGLERVLHLENDVWIHSKFPFAFFEAAQIPIAFPRVDSERGIASTLFINGEEGIRILERACSDWPTLTDMQILGNILNSNPKEIELRSTSNLQSASPGEWLFDGAKLGMYLFGSDPRNNRGIIKRFAYSPMKNLEGGQKIVIESDFLLLQTTQGSNPIASLHIHSKDTSIFQGDWKASVERQLLKAKLRICFGFSWNGFQSSFIEFVGRLVRKLRSLI
jgi:hypothetical protein